MRRRKVHICFFVEEKPKMGFVILSKYLQKCTQNANTNAKGCDGA